MNKTFTVFRLFGVAAMLSALAACATVPQPSSRMRLAAATAAPVAYLDYCARALSDCDAGMSAADVASLRLEAQKVAWNAIFSGQSLSAPAATGASLAAAPDWNAIFASASLADTKPAPQSVTADVPVDPDLPKMDAAFLKRLNAVNRKINHDLLRQADDVRYGIEDYWATPLSDGQPALGDCEDYVLEKRKALLATGVSKKALDIAVVTTAWGETHAVLLVNTDQGEYVLDNLSSFIVPWEAAPYKWRERQFGGAAFVWGVPAAMDVAPRLLTIAAR